MPLRPSSESKLPDKSEAEGSRRSANSSGSKRNVPPSSSGVSWVHIAVATTSTQHGASQPVSDCKQGETQGDVPPSPPQKALSGKNKRKRDYSGVSQTQTSGPTKTVKMALGVGQRDHHSKVSKGQRDKDLDDPQEGPSYINRQSTIRPSPLPMPSCKVNQPAVSQAEPKNTQTPRASQKRKISSSVQGASKENTGQANPSTKKKRHSEPSVEKTSNTRAAQVTFESSYTLGERLGKGGYGCVYAGTRKSDGLQVAIKVIPRASVTRFICMDDTGVSVPLEVALMMLVSKPPECPNIIKLLEWFEGPAVFIFILEHPVPCSDLFRYCRSLDSHLSESEIKDIMRQVVYAAKHCIDHGVLHRDIKPENLLITEDKTIKLIDFGCGDLLKETPYNNFAGTKGYCPPEWFLEKSYQGESATVWSIGVLLYVLLCGRLPFVGEEQIVSGPIQFRRGLPCECRNLIHWCLRKDPAKRPSLEQILRHKWLTGAV